MASAAWMSMSASSERRSDYDSILKPVHPRDRKMSLDFSGPPGNIYAQPELDAFNVHHDPQHHPPAQMHISPHALDRPDSLDAADHPSYDLFSAGSSAQRFRQHSASTPMTPYSNPDMYPQGPFPDALPSFNGASQAPYDMLGGLAAASFPKSAPLSPTDALSPMQYSAGGFPPQNKDYHAFPDMPDRRMSAGNGGGGFQPEYNEDYGMGGAGGGMPLGGFPPAQLHGFQERMRMQGERFQGMLPAMQPGLAHLQGHQDLLHGVSPHATHAFREGMTYDDLPPYMAPNPRLDFPIRIPSVDETFSNMRLQSSDLQTFIRPYLDQYVRTPNRLAFGEKTVIVMSSKVAQKSYGTEKRFLCPPPTAIMIGNSWWSDVQRRGEEPKSCPPRVVVSISGEPAPQEGSVEWQGGAGKPFDTADPPTGTTFVGRCVGKQLFISDVDEKKKKVEALVKIMAPSSDDEPERVIGTFPSRPIKVISKPSKKRQSAKNLELCINHGSTISLFHRLRSQTVSTKYLCVSGSGSSFKGSDGNPLMGLDQRSRSSTPSFIARTASWDPFIMYIVDVNKPAGGVDAPPPPPLQPEYPSPPPNAIPATNNGSQIPIYYNQTVVLQCLTSGVVSPVLIIRKVDHQTTAVGGGLQDGAKGVADHYCVPGEVCGDPVSQLHKIALEVYDATKPVAAPGEIGQTGAFLSCMGEKVNTYRPVEGRAWVAPPHAPQSESPTQSPGSPSASTPTSTGPADYFAGPGGASSTPASPDPADVTHDGGRVKKPKRGSSSGGGLTKPSSQKGRRRPASAGSAGSSRRATGGDAGASSGALWQVDIGETSVWTIVGTDQIRYNFYVPPVLFDAQNASPTGSFPVPSKPVTPFPGVVKYLPPDRAAELPKHHSVSARGGLAKPNPHASKMLTLYGENFSKTDPVTVFFGSEPSPYVEVRCAEVLGCLPPDSQSAKRRPIVLVRGDGVVFPSNVYYP